MRLGKRLLSRTVAAAALIALTAPAAFATEGYFQYGYGARQKGLAGAGVADSRDATAASLNPAGLTHLKGTELDFSATLFSPSRDMTGSGGPGFTPTGEVESKNNYFAVPNFAWAKQLHNNALADTIAVTLYGNGGMNTSWPGGSYGGCMGMPARGVFCGGTSGVNLQQALMSFAAAKKIGNFSIGIAPIVAMQQFEAKGIGALAWTPTNPPAPTTIDTGNFSNRDVDTSWGYGIRGGIEWAITPGVRLGLAGNSRILMQEFKRYRGLFAEQGGFDIPASLQAGVAIDLTPRVTFMADYKHIWYNSVASIGNPSTNNSAPLGSDDGAGFGWKDVDVIKLGLEWREAMPGTTLRLGYAHNTNPITSRDVMFNILAPGVVQDHFAAGAEVKLTRNTSLELAGAYVPRNEVSGSELGNPNHKIEIGMSQYEITMGVKYKWDAGPEPLK